MASLHSAGVKRRHRFSKVVGQARVEVQAPMGRESPAAVLLRSRVP